MTLRLDVSCSKSGKKKILMVFRIVCYVASNQDRQAQFDEEREKI